VPTGAEVGRRLVCHALPLSVAIPVVALAAAPGFAEPFTSPKWYAFAAVAAGWLLCERFACRAQAVPSFVRRTRIGWIVLGSWILGGALRHGPGWAMEPLLARTAFAALVLVSYWSFRRQAWSLGALRVSMAVAAGVVIALGLLQMAGLQPLPWLSGGDGRAATFGNVNMAAQFAGLALVVLLSRPWNGEALRRRVPMELLGLAGFAYVALAGTRSVALALVAGFAVLALLRRSRESLARAGLAAAVAVLVLVLPALHENEGAASSKAASARWRLAVWADTLDLVRDHPLGVGAGNFEDAFTSYALAGRSRPGEALVFRSPHDEYLRLVAEEGLPAAALLLVLLVLLVRDMHRSPAMGGWGSEVGALLAACGAFLAVEALFQFPFELAFPAFLSAVLLGLALSAADPGPGAEAVVESRLGRAASHAADAAVLLVAALLLAGTARVAWADHLIATRRGDLASLEQSCRLDPRRLDACVKAAWHDSRAGRHEAAQARLAEVLARSPAYCPALKLRAEDLLAAGRRDEGCRRAREYDALFGGASSLHALAARECGDPGGTSPP
jgi:O-antigen ligase